MDHPKYIDTAALGLAALWLILSVYFISVGLGDYFQRMGSFGVALVIGYFGFVRIFSSNPAPPKYHEMLHQQRRQFVQHATHIEQSYLNTSLLAAALEQEAGKEGKQVHLAISALAKPVRENAELGKKSPKLSGFEKESEQIAKEGAIAEETIKNLANRHEALQAIVGVMATLQWGFGDLLVGGGTS